MQTSIYPVNFKNVKGFLVIQNQQAMMVDTGYAEMSEHVGSILNSRGLDWNDLKLILLTHTHFDHAGGACKLKELTGADIIVHRREAAFLERGRTPIPPGTRWKGKLISWFGRVFYRKIEKYTPVIPDIVFDDEYLLEAHGFSGRVIHTPGHTHGSCSLVLDNGHTLVGDLMLGISKKEHFPPFAVSRHDVLKSWAKILETSSAYFYPAHGQRINRTEIENQFSEAKKKYG